MITVLCGAVIKAPPSTVLLLGGTSAGRGRAHGVLPLRNIGSGRGACDLLAERLRVMRERTGRSLKELRGSVHASDSSLSRYLSGRIVPPWNVVQRLGEAAHEDPAGLRPLWDHLQRDDHRKGRCVPVLEFPPPSAPPAANPTPQGARIDRATGHRRRPAVVVGTLMLVTALVFGGLGVWLGLELAPAQDVRTGLTSTQDSSATDGRGHPPAPMARSR
ncbi:helix-turn-helix transcriptional regulator [Streptomyces sp. NPDC051576]|uniref:helix-turn-helix domain-containing protein n=1 Tax=Streptomyces sp. NPDC051576 TaxID=3155803 RepID=UPI0034222DA7